MRSSFNPERLTPTASLNRVPIVDLPGVAVEEFARGKTAYELLAARTLAGDVRLHADVLGHPALAAASDQEVLRRFAGCFADDDPHIRTASDAIVQRFGHALGALILTLKRGDVINRAARFDWDESYWAYWSGIDTIWLGGGLANGQLGASIQYHAQALLRMDEVHVCDLRLAAHPSFLPLIGAARSLPPASRTALVFDFGQSVIKRAVAHYAEGVLTSLHLLPSLPAPATFVPGGDELTLDQLQSLAEQMVDVLAATWQHVSSAHDALVPRLVASMACYEADGQPLPRQGGPYAQLHRLSPNLARWLIWSTSQRLGHPLDVVLLHDGTAAAQTYAGAPTTAVIMLGTALGIGFAPREVGWRPLAASFTLREEDGAPITSEPAGEGG